MFHSGSDSWLNSVRLKASRKIVWFVLLCVLCGGLSSWLSGQQAAAAVRSNQQLVLRQREEPDPRKGFEPQNFIEMLAASRWATPMFATITVTTTADTVAADGLCSLREAILAANSNASVNECTAGTAGLDTIQFALGAGTPTINLTDALPTITEPVTINGNTGGATRVELNGTNAGAGNSGLVITAGDSTISNLVINSFSGDGINIQTNGNNIIRGCYIGTDAAGANASANGGEGISVFSTGNTIGGTASGAAM